MTQAETQKKCGTVYELARVSVQGKIQEPILINWTYEKETKKCDYGEIEYLEDKGDTHYALCKGKLYAVGSNVDGKLGVGVGEGITPIGDKSDVPIPVDIEGKVKEFSCGKKHIIVLNEDGKVFCFGGNEFGQCGKAFESKSEEPIKNDKKGNL